MGGSDDLSSGESAGPQEKGGAPKLTSESQRTSAPSWRLHAVMLTVGLGLLLAARSLQSMNVAIGEMRGDAGSAAELLRMLLHMYVDAGAVVLVVVSPMGLLEEWWQARWPPPDPVSSRWEERYRLAPPSAHQRMLKKFSLLAFGYVYGCVVLGAVVPTVVALLLVPDLYDPLSGASPAASSRAVNLIENGTFMAAVSLGAMFVLCIAGLFWTDRKRVRRLESWLDQGVPVCLACGYPLRGLDSPACPECGAAWSQWYPSKDGRPVLPT